MMELQIAELERATQLVQLPHLSQAERQSATTPSWEFRRAARPYDLCRRLLAASANPLLMFEAASTMRHALLREWRDLPADAVEQLRVSRCCTCWEKGGTNCRSSCGSRWDGRVLLAVCTMAKLWRHAQPYGGRDGAAADPAKLGSSRPVAGLRRPSRPAKRIPAGQVRLAWEEHRQAEAPVRGAGLLRAFVLCVRCAAASATSSEFVASNADLLLPLPAGNGSVLRGAAAGAAGCRRPGLTGFANVFANLCQHSGGCCSSLDRLPAALASQAAELTVRALEAAASASSASGAADASAGVSEAADSLLDAWAHLFAADSSGGPFDSGSAADLASAASSTEASAASTVGPIAQTLFAALMRSRLAPPDGFRAWRRCSSDRRLKRTTTNRCTSWRRRTRFDSLRSGRCWRICAPGAGALDQRAELLAGVQQPGASAAAVWSASEDAHWLLLVVGHEAAPFVPRSLMSESLAQSANVAESVRALCEAFVKARAEPAAATVSRLIACCSWWPPSCGWPVCWRGPRRAQPAGERLIRLVLTDIAWLLSRLSRVYFGLDETLYDTISPPSLLLSDSGESLRCCAQFAVDYCRVCLARWPGEPELANEAAKLIIKYCGSSGTRVRRTSKLNFLSSLVASLPSWWQLAQDIGALTPPLTQAPPAALSTAVRAVVQAGRALSTAADQPAKDGRHSDAVERERTYWGVTVGRLQLRAGVSKPWPVGCVELSDSARPGRRVELGQLVGLLHSMLSQSLLDFWSEPEEHLLDGGETASTGAETEAAAVSGFADLLPADPAELAEPTLRLCVAAAEAASDRLLAMPEEALNSLAMGCLRPALAGELSPTCLRMRVRLGPVRLAAVGPPRRSAAGRPALPQSNSAPSDPAAAAASLDGLDSGGSLVSDAVLASVWADPAAFAALADAWLISDGGSSPDERRRERLGDALNQLATGVAEAAAASSRTAPSGSVNGAGAQSRRFPDRPARLAFAEQFEMFLVRLRAIAIV
uniref:Importin N-terminal domain-containing protein n=1 Tax=Macrostomum lignano TaxID=282301 RepID=A0A1I8JNE4_9PLAT